MKKISGVLSLVICSLGWSLAGIFIKYVTVNSFAIAGFRSLIAFFTIAALSKKLPRFVIRSKVSEKEITEVKTKPPVDKKRTLYLWISAVTYALTMIIFCIANKLTYAANAVLLQYTFPIWVISFGPFLLREKNTKVDYITIGGVVIGMLLFFADTIFGASSGEFAQTEVLGNILGFVSGITFGLTTLFQRKQQIAAVEAGVEDSDANSSNDAFMIAQIITAVFGISAGFAAGNGMPDVKSLIFLVLLGTVQMGLPNYMYAVGIKTVRALSASLITMIEPLMNPVWVLIFVHEVPELLCIIGGLIIIGCVVLREVLGRKHSEKKI